MADSAPTVQPARLRLAVIGDPHIAVARGADDPRLEPDPGRKLHGRSVELLRATIAAVNAEPQVDAALILGDLTRDSEQFNHEVARSLLAQLRVPYYIVLGNHDLLRRRPPGSSYDEPHFDRRQTVEFHHAGFPGGQSRYSVALPGQVELIVLDSNLSLEQLAVAGLPEAEQETGRISAEQVGWCEQRLAAARQAGHTPLVAVHHSVLVQSPAERAGHPLFNVFRHWRLDDAAPLLACMQQHCVPLVLSGHLHTQSVNASDGMYNLITSASVSYPHAWRILAFYAERIDVESRLVESIPSCPGLQRQSRRWMAEGMGELILRHAAKLPLLSDMASEIVQCVSASGWWPRFCDGTLAGFRLDASSLLPEHPLGAMARQQIAALLDEYGSWKAARSDPNTLTIPLR